MADLFDYIAWRGDLSLEQSGLNEVDSLILSELSYILWDEIVPGLVNGSRKGSQRINLRTAGLLFFGTDKPQVMAANSSFMEKNVDLLETVMNSPRFRDLEMLGFVDHIDEQNQKQFSAVTFDLMNGSYYVSFRGTDSTLVGWKESLNMSFATVIPSQEEAVWYLNQIASCVKGTFYLGGHSKGGNLAVYAAAMANEEVKERIIHIDSFDGPGFSKKIIEKEQFSQILSKITAFLPQSSIVGMLLEHQEDYQIVTSTQSGILQHDCFSWQLTGTFFLREEELSSHGRFMNQAIQTWLSEIEPKEFNQFIDAVYEIMMQTEAKTLADLSMEKRKNMMKIMKTYSHCDPEVKEQLKLFIKELIAATRKGMKKQNKNKNS